MVDKGNSECVHQLATDLQRTSLAWLINNYCAVVS